jgi:hypothetical protein
LGSYRTLEMAQEQLKVLPKPEQKVGWKEEILSKMQESSKKIPEDCKSVTLCTLANNLALRENHINSVSTDILNVIFTYIALPDLLNARK